MSDGGMISFCPAAKGVNISYIPCSLALYILQLLLDRDGWRRTRQGKQAGIQLDG